MFCKNCGLELDDDAKFCKRCGIATTSCKEEFSAPQNVAPTQTMTAVKLANNPTEQNQIIEPCCKLKKSLLVLTIITSVLFIGISIFTIFFYPATFLRIGIAVIGILTTILATKCILKISEYIIEQKKYQAALNGNVTNGMQATKAKLSHIRIITIIGMIIMITCAVTFSSPRIKAINIIQRDTEEKISYSTVLYNAELNACIVEYRVNGQYNTAYIQFWENAVGYKDVYEYIYEYGTKSDLLDYLDYYDAVAVLHAQFTNDDSWKKIIY